MVTEGNREAGDGQGAVGGRRAGSGWAGSEGGIGGAPVKFGDPKLSARTGNRDCPQGTFTEFEVNTHTQFVNVFLEYYPVSAS
jgi:hypothetical protein